MYKVSHSACLLAIYSDCVNFRPDWIYRTHFRVFRGIKIKWKEKQAKNCKKMHNCYKNCPFKKIFSVFLFFPYFSWRFLMINVQEDLRNNKSIESGLIALQFLFIFGILYVICVNFVLKNWGFNFTILKLMLSSWWRYHYKLMKWLLLTMFGCSCSSSCCFICYHLCCCHNFFCWNKSPNKFVRKYKFLFIELNGMLGSGHLILAPWRGEGGGWVEYLSYLNGKHY